MSDNPSQPSNPFEYNVVLTEIAGDGYDARLEANKAQRDAMASRFKITAVDEFVAKIHLFYHKSRGEIDVHGVIDAKIEQECVVSLQPVETVVTGDFDETLVIEGQGKMPQEKDEDDDIPDKLYISIDPGPIDLAEIAVQNLSLLIPDYPRKPGASIDDRYAPGGGSEKDIEKDTPFSVLRELQEEE